MVSEQRRWLIERLGGHCVRCGEADPRVLQIDHVRGGGGRERASGVNLNAAIAERPDDYQLLCANCNWRKRDENGEDGSSPYRSHGSGGKKVVAAMFQCRKCGAMIREEQDDLLGRLLFPVSCYEEQGGCRREQHPKYFRVVRYIYAGEEGDKVA